jgi:hypothetical protein
MMRASTLVLCFVFTAASSATQADEPDPAQLFPASTAGFVEFSDPPAALSVIVDHPLRQAVESLDAWKQLQEQQQYANFLTGLKLFEIQIGKEWREAVESLSAHGIAAGFDPETEGFAVVMRGENTEIMETFRAKLLELLRLNQELKVKEYRGITTYQLDENKTGVAVVGEWLVLTNKGELGKHIIDSLMDGVDDQDSLATNAHFKSALAQRRPEATVWGFVDLDVIRQLENIQQALETQSVNPGVELILGGIQSAIRQTPWLTGEFALHTGGVGLTFATPLQSDWIPEERMWFFGPGNSGTAPQLPEVPETLLTLATYRGVSEMWLRAGDLFDENMNDQLAEADSNLTTLFAGRDFGEDILGSFRPEFGLVSARQDFTDVLPSPAIRLPSFALVLRMKEPETMTRELRRTFQSMIGFFNVVGAMEGRPQLEMDMEKTDGAELVTSMYIPEDDERDSTRAGLLFNFSPSVGFAGEYCVISSTANLARTIVTAERQANTKHQTANTVLNLDATVLKSVLQDNREQLITQNMLEDGNTREEAASRIDLLLLLIGHVKSGGLSLETADEQLRVNLNVALESQ